MLSIRLFRTGKKNQPFFKIVVTDNDNACVNIHFEIHPALQALLNSATRTSERGFCKASSGEFKFEAVHLHDAHFTDPKLS